MMEIEDLRTKEAWVDFVGSVRDAIQGQPRHALAQHTTDSNQPGKARGVSGSLKASGADVLHEVEPGVFECHIALENLLENDDGHCLKYVSEPQRSKKQAQRSAFVEILSYIIFRGPKHLRNHANQWHADRLNAVKGDAASLEERLGPRPRGMWSSQSRRDAQATRQWSAHSNVLYVPPAHDEDPADCDERILAALMLVGTRENRGELPPNVWPVLARELPPGGLLPFLQRFPDRFTIISDHPLVWQKL